MNKWILVFSVFIIGYILGALFIYIDIRNIKADEAHRNCHLAVDLTNQVICVE